MNNDNYAALVPVIERLELSRQALEEESDIFNKLTLFDWKIEDNPIIWIEFVRTEFTKLSKNYIYIAMLHQLCDKINIENGIKYFDDTNRLSIYLGSKYAALIIADKSLNRIDQSIRNHLTLTRERADALITYIDGVRDVARAKLK